MEHPPATDGAFPVLLLPGVALLNMMSTKTKVVLAVVAVALVYKLVSKD
jgi:hypothetical protein